MMEVTQQTRSGWRLVHVSGRADAETAAELESQLRSAIQSHPKVAADFSALSYISSAGIRAVLQAARAAQENKVEFAVCTPSAPVRKVFDMSGLHHILTIHGELPC
jgi:anti-sigma B factor antagonist